MANLERFALAKRRRRLMRDGVDPGEVTWQEVLHILGPGVSLVNEPMTPQGDEVRILVIEADPDTIRRKREALPRSILLEREIPHLPLQPFRWPFRQRDGRALVVRAVAGGVPIAGALVQVTPREDVSTQWFEVLTNEDGEVELPIDAADVESVVIAPLTGYWAVKATNLSGKMTVQCPRLDLGAGLGWWHRALGIRKPDPRLGTGIRIGVLETGIGRHPALEGLKLVGTWKNGSHFPDEMSQGGVTYHGTHVCGILKARPIDGIGYWGIAPGAEVLAGSCYGDRPGAAQWDIANGIRSLAEEHQVDLINLSHGSPYRSRILLEAIQDAADAGCVCICAAGNSSGVVEWPARSAATVGVTALGRAGAYPVGTRSASLLDSALSAGDGFFFARFSCYGEGVTCCGPGVGVISTVPELPGLDGQFWAPMDGTSMAAPAVCGALAVRLSRSARYRSSERDRHRARLARRILLMSCCPNALGEAYQGKGMPSVRSRHGNTK